MASLFALLSQNNKNLQTRKGLIVLGLQHDFISHDGKLPVKDTEFLNAISELVRAFRQFGDVIWVRSEFTATRPVHAADTNGDVVIAGRSSGIGPALECFDSDEEHLEDKIHDARAGLKSVKDHAVVTKSTNASRGEQDDEELFLSRSANRELCCIRGSRGAEYCDEIKSLIQKGKDLEVTKSHYSAFGSTSLLLTLRSKLITELYVCGCITNLSVYATAMDAARHGIKIILVDDCLGYRRLDRHEMAIKQLKEFMEADALTKDAVLRRLRNPSDDSEYEYSEASEASSETFECLPIAGSKSVEMTAREADVDDSDEEVHLTNSSSSFKGKIVIPHPCKTSGSPPAPAAGRSRVPSFEPSQSSSSPRLSTHCNIKTATINEEEVEAFQSERNSTTCTGQLTGRESSRHDSEPSLDCIGHPMPDAHTTSNSTPNMSALTDHPGLVWALSSIDKADDVTFAEYKKANYTRTSEVTANDPTTRSWPLFGEKKEDESAESRIMFDLLPMPFAERIFKELHVEVSWQKMYHQTSEVPRLVSCQGTIEADGSMPVYRHPSDRSVSMSPWTTNVDLVRKAAEEVVGQPLNHVLIQLYRGGKDNISEHSDKTLDIAIGSKIVNVSFGAQRTLRLRTKRRVLAGEAEPPPRTTYRVRMPHNSMITMSLETNAKYLHGINADKRPQGEWTEAEKAYDGQRISLTFRQIATYINKDSSKIWGQGAIGKTAQTARQVVNGDPVESERLVHAFSKENRASNIAWREIYGDGSDVLHMSSEQL